MNVVQFIKDVVPEGGRVAIGSGRGGPFYTRVATNGADLLRVVAKAASARQIDFYFTPAGYGTAGLDEEKLKGFRTAANCVSKKCFAIDIDLNHEKKPSYATKTDAMVGLAAAVKSLSMPKPTYIIDSGRGLHVYWALDEAVAPAQWLPVATELKAKLIATAPKLMVDPTRAADLAGYLRLPGSWNTKSGSQVKILAHNALCSLQDLMAVAGTATPSLPFSVAPAPMRRRQLDTGNNETTSIADPIKLVAQCPPLAKLAVTPDLQGYDAWQGAARLFARSADKDAGLDAFQRFSKSHPGYSEAKTTEKFANALDTSFASPSCAQMRDWAGMPPAACRNCPLFRRQGANGKPAALQSEFSTPPEPLVPADEDTEPEHLAGVRSGRAGRFVPFSLMGRDLPPVIKRKLGAGVPGLFTNNLGKLMLRVPEDGEDENEHTDFHVGEYPLWLEDIVSERREDGQLGSGIRMGMARKSVDDEWEVRYVTIRREAFNQGGAALLAELSDLRCGLTITTTRDKRWFSLQNELVRQYATTPAEQSVEKAERYGWFNIDDPESRSFVVGDRRYYAGGRVQLIEQAHNARVFNKFVPQKGKLSVAVRNFADVIQQAEFDAAFAMLISLGTPLVAMTNMAGALFYIDGGTGMGKTLLMHYCASFFGTPAIDGLPARGEDTRLSIPNMMGTASSIPFMIDEMTDMGGDDLSSFVMSITSGRERNRLHASTNAIRETSQWRIIAVASSNKSLSDQLTRFDAATEARFARSIVSSLDDPGMPGRLFRNGVDPIVARITELQEHHGVLGPAFAKYVLNNFDRIKQRLKEVETVIRDSDGLLGSGDRDHMRIWRTTCVIAMVTAEILAPTFMGEKGMGVVDLGSSFISYIRATLENRAAHHMSAGDGDTKDTKARMVLADYINYAFSSGEGAVYEYKDASGAVHDSADVVRQLSAINATHYPRRNASVGLYLKEGEAAVDILIRRASLKRWCEHNDVDIGFLLHKLRDAGILLQRDTLGNPAAGVSLPGDSDKVSTITGSTLPPTKSVLVRWPLGSPFKPGDAIDWQEG